ncbi:MAG TPA: LytTR family DNA-binding domain-containing protein [Bacteroidales bacterium]|nr:LytTR family DNA-binding domain-containing protein [Bacteroidales bacterium]
MKVLIIEDETRAANRLIKLLEKLAPEAELINTLESVRDSVKFLKSNTTPDLIFSDIQLADGLSFEIFKQVEVQCPIIFTTAYDQYAIEAFNTNGIDYLLKPIEEERLEQALKKLESLSAKPDMQQIIRMMAGNYPLAKKYKSRFMVKVGEQIKTISTSEIVAFYSFDTASFIHTQNKRNYIVDFSLDQLEELLDPGKFYRVNRKFIVSLQACGQIYAWSNSRLKIEVEGLDEEIVVARERVLKFKEWLDGGE